MSPSLEQIKATVCGLSTTERADLAHYLLQTLEPEEQEATAEWLALAEQRMGEVRAGWSLAFPPTKSSGTC